MKTAIVVSISPTSFEALAMSADVDRAFKLSSELGFDAVEVAVRDPAKVTAASIIEKANKNGLNIAAIGTGQAWVEEGLSLTSPDADKRRLAMERLKAQVDLSKELSAQVIIGLIRGTVDNKDDIPGALDVLATAMSDLGEYAKDTGAPGLLIEPINRYETRLLNSVEQTVEFMKRLSGLPVKILADTFHMNIEDRDMAASIKMAGAALGHVHFADSNRWAPGQGHIDFGPILSALSEMGYEGYLSAEIMAEPSPEEAMELAAGFFRKAVKNLQ